MLKNLWKKSSGCSLEDARFLMLLCLGREPYSEAELEQYSELSFFGALKRLLAGPAFAHTLFDPLALGKHPMQTRLSADQITVLQRGLITHFKENIPKDICRQWPQVLELALSTPRMQKAFLWAHSHDRLTYLQQHLDAKHPTFTGAAHVGGANFVHGFAFRDDDPEPLTLEFYLNGIPAGTTVADNPNPEVSTRYQRDSGIAFHHTLDLTAAGQPTEATMLVFEKASGVMVCPPKDMLLGVRVANEMLARISGQLDTLGTALTLNDIPSVQDAISDVQRRLPALEQFADIPLSDYAAYRAVYQPDPDSISDKDGPKIGIVTTANLAKLNRWIELNLDTQTYRNFEIIGVDAPSELSKFDLILPVSGKEKLHPKALQCLAVTANAQPDKLVFRAGFDHVTSSGSYSDPMFVAAFDPLVLEQIPTCARAFAVRRRALADIKNLAAPVNTLTQLFREHGADAFTTIEDVLFSYPENAEKEEISSLNLPAPNTKKTLSIIIPSKDHLELLKPCVESLEKTLKAPETTEIIIIDNGSSDADTVAWLETAAHASSPGKPAVRVLAYDKPFNWAEINNYAANESNADILLFLNNDTLATETGWDLKLRSLLELPDVGVVGARLLFAGDTIQHSGIIVNADGTIHHEGANLPKDAPGYANRLQITRRCEAVTGAFLACNRTDFDHVNGFDASQFPVTYNDIDFCLEMSACGKTVLYTPLVTFYHLESRSRGYDEASAGKRARKDAEQTKFIKKWGNRISVDRWFPQRLHYRGGNGQILIRRPASKPERRLRQQ